MRDIIGCVWNNELSYCEYRHSCCVKKLAKELRQRCRDLCTIDNGFFWNISIKGMPIGGGKIKRHPITGGYIYYHGNQKKLGIKYL